MQYHYISHTINWKYYLVCLIIFCLFIALYFAGTYILYGIDLLINPGYNTTTGCPIGKQTCDKKMTCYENNMWACYFLGLPAIIIVLQIIILVFAIIWYVFQFLFVYLFCCKKDLDAFPVKYEHVQDCVNILHTNIQSIE